MGRKNNNRPVEKPIKTPKRPSKSVRTLDDRFDENTQQYKSINFDELIPARSKPSGKQHPRRRSSPRR